MNKNTISADATLREALSRLNGLPGNAMTLFAIDKDGRVAGTLTDGDVRRALLAGADLQSPVSEAMHRKFRYIGAGISPETVRAIAEMRAGGIKLIPRLDDDGRLMEIIDTTVTRNRLPLSAVLMAGGRGERLRPLTLETPKPLLPIDGKPIIDYNIEALAACGISDVTVITRYLAEQIHNHFAEPVEGIKVKCVKEEGPALGTIGGITLAKFPKEGTTLVMNSDLLTTLSLEDMYLRHCETGAAITVAAIPYKVSVPYAILEQDGDGFVTGIAEKPVYSLIANAGIYLFDNAVLATLTPGERCDATDLIERCMAEGKKVGHYVIDGTWIDIGAPADLARAKDLMRHIRQLSGRRNK